MIPANFLVAGEQHAGEQCGRSSQDSDTSSDSGLGYSSAPTNPDSEDSAGSPDSTSETLGSKEAQRT